MSHTLGPWTRVFSAGAWLIRGPERTGSQGKFSPRAVAQIVAYEPEDDSNAQLIVAAPDMLAALYLLRADFGADYQGPTIDAMNAAIAKAERTAP